MQLGTSAVKSLGGATLGGAFLALECCLIHKLFFFAINTVKTFHNMSLGYLCCVDW